MDLPITSSFTHTHKHAWFSTAKASFDDRSFYSVCALYAPADLTSQQNGHLLCLQCIDPYTEKKQPLMVKEPSLKKEQK